VFPVRGAKLRRDGIRSRVVVAIGKSESALVERENDARAVLEIRLGATAEHDGHPLQLQLRDLRAQPRKRRDGVDARETRLQGRDPLRFYGEGVHARRVVDAGLVRGVVTRSLGRILQHASQHDVAAVGNLAEGAVRGIRGGNLGALEPPSVRVLVEIGAGVARGVDVRAIDAVCGCGILGAQIAARENEERRCERSALNHGGHAAIE
jgi:hypothetical protein